MRIYIYYLTLLVGGQFALVLLLSFSGARFSGFEPFNEWLSHAQVVGLALVFILAAPIYETAALVIVRKIALIATKNQWYVLAFCGVVGGIAHGWDQGWERAVITCFAFSIYSKFYAELSGASRQNPFFQTALLHAANNAISLTPLFFGSTFV